VLDLYHRVLVTINRKLKYRYQSTSLVLINFIKSNVDNFYIESLSYRAMFTLSLNKLQWNLSYSYVQLSALKLSHTFI